jgi:hypothetical protein
MVAANASTIIILEALSKSWRRQRARSSRARFVQPVVQTTPSKEITAAFAAAQAKWLMISREPPNPSLQRTSRARAWGRMIGRNTLAKASAQAYQHKPSHASARRGGRGFLLARNGECPRAEDATTRTARDSGDGTRYSQRSPDHQHCFREPLPPPAIDCKRPRAGKAPSPRSEIDA